MFNDIYKLLASDKALHFLYAYVILDCLIPFIPLYIALCFIAGIIVFKELIDKATYGVFSWYDILAGICGILCKLLVVLLSIKYV